jgi:hypothetical protein
VKLSLLDEPTLEFGGGMKHIDPRFGIASYGPADATVPSAPKRIRLGIVGDAASVEGIATWLDRCRHGIPAKSAKAGQECLFPEWPGFDLDSSFRCELVLDQSLQRAIPERTLRILQGRPVAVRVPELVGIYLDEMRALAEGGGVDVIVCTRPDSLLEPPPTLADELLDEDDEAIASPAWDFHDYLKARAMELQRPLQVVRNGTWDPAQRTPGRRLQDEATRAWNLLTALYYKAGGVPWRLVRDTGGVTSCFVGVSFYKTLDGGSLHTSVAQVFNDRGDGIIVRGGQAHVCKLDRQPHLNAEDSRKLLCEALERYRIEHQSAPARVVLHKSSTFSEEEIAGFRAAADDQDVASTELIWLTRSDGARLYGGRKCPPRRGTLLSLEPRQHVLYTRGHVDFYGTYPGMYVPSPIGIRPVAAQQSPRVIARELLALTKLNWNNTQFDNRQPVTLRTAERVGSILKYVGPDEILATRYAYYM